MSQMIMSTEPIHHVEHVMGMPVSFDVRSPCPPLGSVRDAVEWLHHVDVTFSTYSDDSIITKIGRGELAESDAPADVRSVLRECRRLTELTGGAFNAFGIRAANGTLVDPSGLVKGWSVQVAASLLADAGAENFCIDAAGDIALVGQPQPGRDWVVGVRHPFETDQLATTLHVSGPLAVATSAHYERGRQVIDPRNGIPASKLISATVFGPDLGLANAYATAVFVMGRDGLDWIDDQVGYEAYIITSDEMTHWTEGFEAAWPYR